MKRIIMIVTIFILIVAAGLGVFGGMAIDEAAQHQVQTVQNLAGAVITGYPQTEPVFVDALMDSSYQTAEAGAAILAHYGYDTDMGMEQQYKSIMRRYILISVLLLCVVAGYGYGILFLISKRQKRQEENLLALLDCCLSGDYSFIDQEKALEPLGNPVFADALVKLAASLQLKTERLNEERDHTKTLVTDISHQLKTPISAMKVCFSMYLEAEDEAEAKEFFMRGKRQLGKLEALAASLINISRLETGMITLRREETSLMEILVDAVNTVYHKASAKHIDVATQEFEDVMLRMDQKWTVEAVANVLDNAVKYSPEGSCIEVRVQKMYSFVRIEVQDQGVGIPKEDQNKIFQRFYRGNSDVVKNEEGSGVGLYLSRKILEEQGGTISVRSRQEAGGSVFILQLPL